MRFNTLGATGNGTRPTFRFLTWIPAAENGMVPNLQAEITCRYALKKGDLLLHEEAVQKFEY